MANSKRKDYLAVGRSAIDYDRKGLFALLSKAEEMYLKQDYKESANHFREAATSYRRVGGLIQKEFVDLQTKYQAVEHKTLIQTHWLRSFRRPQVAPITINGLAREHLWEAIDELQDDPVYERCFEHQRLILIQQGDIMTWKHKARHRWEAIFGLEYSKTTIKLSVAEEIICEKLCNTYFRNLRP